MEKHKRNHQSSALQAISDRNPSVNGEFPSQRPSDAESIPCHDAIVMEARPYPVLYIRSYDVTVMIDVSPPHLNMAEY